MLVLGSGLGFVGLLGAVRLESEQTDSVQLHELPGLGLGLALGLGLVLVLGLGFASRAKSPIVCSCMNSLG